MFTGGGGSTRIESGNRTESTGITKTSGTTHLLQRGTNLPSGKTKKNTNKDTSPSWVRNRAALPHTGWSRAESNVSGQVSPKIMSAKETKRAPDSRVFRQNMIAPTAQKPSATTRSSAST